MKTISSTINRVAIFSDFKVKATRLEHGNLVSIFGSGTADFSGGNLGSNAKVVVCALFGDVELYIPAHWELELHVTTVFGECVEKNPKVETTKAAHVVIEGVALFGDVVITRV
jgi:predicted membrane protein